jgi:hypothetical protein
VAAGAAAAAVAAASLASCDASPYAANIGGSRISQTSFNAELKLWADNPTLTKLAQSNMTSTGAAVQGTGGAGTYSMAFTDFVLGLLMRDRIFGQALAAKGLAVEPGALTTTRAVLEQGLSGWSSMPESVRELLTRDDTVEAVLGAKQVSDSQATQLLGTITSYDFTQVCVVAASTFSQSDAAAITASGKVTGATVCYDQQQFEDQSAAFQKAVVGLTSVGQVSQPVQTTYGYQVLQLSSRSVPTVDGQVKDVVYALSQQSSTSQTLIDAVHSASVKVNPKYGSWSAQTGQVVAPQGPPSS